MFKRLRRLLCGALLVSLLLASVPVPASAAFADVPASHWAAASIQRAVELGLFQGESTQTFGVGREMTRAAFTVAVCRFFGWEEERPRQSTFSDVQDPSAWYYGAVEAAYAHGALTRQTESFRPADPITREELAAMLVRALGYGTIAGLAQDLPTPFRDVRTNAGYISMAYELGLMDGTGDGAFSPDRAATREQAAVILMRLYDKLHRAAPGRVGILPAGAAETDLSGYDAVALSGTRLVYNGAVLLTAQPDAETAGRAQAAIRAAGAKALLHLTGGANIFKGKPADTAALLAEEAAAGGWDGVFLDLPKLKYESRRSLTELVKAVKAALGDKPLYVAAEAPVWTGTAYEGYDYAALSAAADRLVVRVAAYDGRGGGFPTAPLEPLEEVYYALAKLRDAVPGEKLSLLVTSTGASWANGQQGGQVSAARLAELLAQKDTAVHYADRYACAYLTYADKGRETVVWYLDGAAAAERARMAAFFGVDQVCLSDASSVSPELLAGLGA